MRKKIVAIMLVLAMIAMAGCSKKKEETVPDTTEQVAADALQGETTDTEMTDQETADLEATDVAEAETMEGEQGLEESIFDDVPDDADIQTGEKGSQPNRPENLPNGTGNQTNGSGSQSNGGGNQSNGTGNQSGGGGNQNNGTGNQSNGTGNQSGGSGNQNNGNGNQSNGNSPQQGSNQGNTDMDYEDFHAMTPAEQQAFMESFGDIAAFFEWYNKVKEEYEKEHPSIEIEGGGAVDLEGILKGNK